MERPEPKTPGEWQGCVDACAALRLIADLKSYGLLKGGPEIHVDRCDYLLRQGAARGIYPSASDVDLASGIIAALNAELEKES
jgi:hypothetical protein